MDASPENKDIFYCRINDSLITEFNASIYGTTTDFGYKGVYWEAVVYFDQSYFTLNAFARTEGCVKETEVLKFPVNKIKRVKLLKEVYGKSNFKISLILGAALGIIVLLSLLLNPSPGYTNIGTLISFPLFFGIGFTVLIFMMLFFMRSSPGKNYCINLITYDKRVISLFIESEQKDFIIEILSRYFNEPEVKRFPYRDLDLN